MLDNDIRIAQEIVSRKKKNVTSLPYHNSSFIYRTTNEEISKYQFLLNRKDTILSVIASGNQILDSIFAGSKNITGFDISTFPKYYLNLQIAALQCFSLEEFIKFFYQEVDDLDYDDMYDVVRCVLDKDTKTFWDSLLNYFDYSDLKDSTLFSSEPFSTTQVKRKNIYLQSNDNYYKLREQLSTVNITYLTGDIFKLANNLETGYDLVNLSSIMYYNSQDSYRKLLSTIPLNYDGEILTYLYDTNIFSQLNLPNTSVYNFENSKSGIMIYKR